MLGKRVLLSLIIPILALAISGCAQPVRSQQAEVRLSPDVINKVYEDIKDDNTWALGLPDISTKYIKGVKLVTAVIIHNGADEERYIVMRFDLPPKAEIDGDTGLLFYPAPLEAINWIYITERTFILQPMETKIIELEFLIPENTNIKSSYPEIQDSGKRWFFHIHADGIPIIEQEQHLVEVITAAPKVDENTGEVVHDTTLVVNLARPLLRGLKSLLSYTSTLSEDNLKVTEYNEQKLTLTFDGLVEGAEREINIVYNPLPPTIPAYNQKWLITMLE